MGMNLLWLKSQIQNGKPLSKRDLSAFGVMINKEKLLAKVLNELDLTTVSNNTPNVIYQFFEDRSIARIDIQKVSNYLNNNVKEYLYTVVKNKSIEMNDNAKELEEKQTKLYINDQEETNIQSELNDNYGRSYPLEVMEDATKFGFKAANLVYMSKHINFLQDKVSKNSLKISIPKIEAIDQSTIANFLRDKASVSIEEIWKQACDVMKDKQEITPEVEQKLHHIKNLIKETFERNSFPCEVLATERYFIARSTGFNEDRVDLANPGGNESLVCEATPEGISKAIGGVVASYFSIKSLSQRMASGQSVKEVFSETKMPQLSCVCQPFIGDIVSKDTNKNSLDGKTMIGSNYEPTVSGVSYTDGYGNVRIQLTHGANHLIVDGAPYFDVIDIINGQVYMSVRDKASRYQHVLLENGEIKGDYLKNLSELAHEECVNLDRAKEIATICKNIEMLYQGMPMDIEFVIRNNEMHVVQARAVQSIKKNGLALDPKYIAEHNPDKVQGVTVTPNLAEAVAIIDHKDLMICIDIDKALNNYLKLKNGTRPKAIVIQRPAADTSHPAGQFTKDGIPVIQLTEEDYDRARKWYNGESIEQQNTKYQLLVDPQASSVFYLDVSKLPNGNIPYKNGFVKSPLTQHVTAPKQGLFDKRNISSFSLEFLASIGSEEKSKTVLIKDLRAAINYLSNPSQDGLKTNDVKTAIATIIQFVESVYGRSAKRNLISDDLAKTFASTLDHLIQALDNFSNAKDVVKKEQAWKEYLDIHKKFEGILIAPKEQDMFSTSIIEEATRAFKQQRAEQDNKSIYFIPNNISGELRDYVRYLLSFCNQIPREVNQKHWKDFCLGLLVKDRHNTNLQVNEQHQLKKMATILEELRKNNVAQYWINLVVIPKLIEDMEKGEEYDIQKELTNYESTATKTSRNELLEAFELVKQMEFGIDGFATDGFEDKFSNLVSQVQKINRILNIKSRKEDTDIVNQYLSSQLGTRAVDALDLSIKQLQTVAVRSAKESEIKTLTENYSRMIDLFFLVLKGQMKDDHLEKDYLKNLKDLKSKASSDKNGRQFEMPANFDVRDKLFSIMGKKLFSSTINWGDESKITMAAIHTILHQETLLQFSNKNGRYIEQIINIFPQDIRDDISLFIDDNNDLSLQDFKISHPNISITFHQALRHHGVTYELVYNTNNKEITLIQICSGIGMGEKNELNECRRWADLASYTSSKVMGLSKEDVLLKRCKGVETQLYTELCLPNVKELNNCFSLFNDIFKKSFQYMGFYMSGYESSDFFEDYCDREYFYRAAFSSKFKEFDSDNVPKEFDYNKAVGKAKNLIDKAKLNNDIKKLLKSSPVLLGFIYSNILNPSAFKDVSISELKKINKFALLEVILNHFKTQDSLNKNGSDDINYFLKHIGVMRYYNHEMYVALKEGESYLPTVELLENTLKKMGYDEYCVMPLLTSERMKECYLNNHEGKKGFPSAKEICSIIETGFVNGFHDITHFVSLNAMKCYEESSKGSTVFPAFSELIDEDAKHIGEYLLSDGALQCYELRQGGNDQAPNCKDLKNLKGYDFVKTFITPEIINAYKCKHFCSFSKLCEVTIEQKATSDNQTYLEINHKKLEFLIDQNLIKFYKNEGSFDLINKYYDDNSKDEIIDNAPLIQLLEKLNIVELPKLSRTILNPKIERVQKESNENHLY